MSRFNASIQLLTKSTGMMGGLLLSVAGYSQADSSKPVPLTFIFSKYQLPVKSDSATAVSFFSAPVKPSPYKIHYKIKTLTFPTDPRPERPTSFVGAVVNGIIETAIDPKKDENQIVPIKRH